MKNKCIILIGEMSNNHRLAISDIINRYHDVICIHNITTKDVDKIKEELKSIFRLLGPMVEPIIIKGSGIHTEEFIRPIIHLCKEEYPEIKPFLSHCMIFEYRCNNIILTDAAINTTYDSNTINKVINNACDLYTSSFAKDYTDTINISLLNAGGDTNYNTAPAYWKEICENVKTKSNYNIRVEQFDVAVDAYTRTSKGISDTNPANIIVTSSINEGNAIWKTITKIARKPIIGVVTGTEYKIGLLSREDDKESIYKTLEFLIK